MTKPWYTVKARGKVGEISIDDEIGAGGVTAKSFIDAVKALGNVATLRITINSPGGDVTEGFAIIDFLSRHPAKIEILIQGLAASMGSAIAATPGAKVAMTANSTVMIHSPFGGISGNAEEIASFGEALNKMKSKLVALYATRTKLAESKIRALMDRESWLTAEECLELGFIDRIEGAVQIAASTGRIPIHKLPKALQWQTLQSRAWSNFNRRRAGP